MTKDERNEKCLSDYMDSRGIAPEDRDVMPWEERKVHADMTIGDGVLSACPKTKNP